MIGVYKILNKVDGKFYIGSSVNVDRRIKSHIKALNTGVHNNQYLQRAWDKYGKENFEFSIIEEVLDINKLRDRETYYIQTTNCTNHSIGYNMLNNANIGFGVKASDEVRSKISIACTGCKNGNYGRKHTNDELQKIRVNRWGKAYVKKPRTYVHKSEEEKMLSRKRMSERMKNQVMSEETKHKISLARIGTHHSEETKAKFRVQRKGEGNGNSKLSKNQVFEIYEKMNAGVNYKEVCEEYGIGQCLVYKIKRKEHWAFNDK